MATPEDMPQALRRWPVPMIDRVATADGLRIRRGRWPTSRPRRGTAVVMNGRTEFIEKYAELAHELGGRGLDVVTWDWRGQGLSDGRLPANPLMGHAADFGDYLLDIEAATADMDRSRPLIVIGHSMGGHMALRAVAEERLSPAATVLTAPLCGLRPVRGLPAPVIGRLAWLACVLGRGEAYPPGQSDLAPSRRSFDNNPVTSDRDRYNIHADWLAHHPDLTVGGPTWSWLLAAWRSCRHLSRPPLLEGVTTPVTVFQAGGELLVDNDAQDRVVARLPRGRLVRIDEARHEIMLETDAIRRRFWRILDDILAQALPAQAAR